MKFLSYILVAAISFGAAFLLISKPDSEPAMVVLEDTDDSANLEPTPYDSYYNKLTDFQKKIYNMILPAIEKHSKEITLENVNISDFKKNCPTVMLAIQYDRPDLFWYTGGARYTMRQEPFKEYGTVVFTPYNYSFAGSFFNYNKKQQQLTEAVKEVASLAKKHGSTDYERALFVHDYLIKNAIYDHDALKDAKSASPKPESQYIYTAYGCLINGKTVCSGYAKAYQLIMSELGIECTYITGDAGGSHGWNCVYLDGEGYFVDITWDDADNEQNTPFYNYAFITSDSLQKTHELGKDFDPVTVCTAKKYDYFVYNGYYDEEFDFETAIDILSKQAGKDAIHIKFGSVEELGEAFDGIIAYGQYKDIPKLREYTKYTYNNDHATLTMFKK